MQWFKKMKIWSIFGVEKKEGILKMLEKKTQVLSLQAYLIHHNNCYQSISIEVLEKMFALDQLTILSEVNLLLVQGLVEASWNEDATVLLFIETLPSRVETVAVQLEEKVDELTETNKSVIEELKGGRKEENAKYKNRKTTGVLAQRNLRTRTHIIKNST